MNVLIIPEDFRNDQYILGPLVTAMFAGLDFPRTKVLVCQEPRLRGVAEAMNRERLGDVLDRYPMVDLFMLCVDRDGETSRDDALRGIEAWAAAKLGHRRRLLGCCAQEEVEVWLLAGLDLPPAWRWRDIRGSRNPKEEYFEKLAKMCSVADGPGGGRRALGARAARNYRRVAQLCPELAELADRLPR